MTKLRCRFCNTKLTHTFCDLGMSPISNAFLHREQAEGMECFFPLHVRVCAQCFLVQLPDLHRPEQHFNHGYAYFSSFSDSWLKHCSDYVAMMTDRFGYNADSLVVEVASNDGYLLQYFKERGVPVLGIEPAANVAETAIQKGIPTRIRFFGEAAGRDLAAEGRQADLLLGNNVLAHVPDINDFVAGMKLALKPGGVITVEFPHLLQLMEQNQFDTIYHEHYSYLSLMAVRTIFEKNGLTLFDVETLWTHGGSLRVFARHADDETKPVLPAVAAMRQREADAGLDRIEGYLGFQDRVQGVKRALLSFLIAAREEGKRTVAYGAPAKGNTLLNYCGVGRDFLDFTVDRSPHKQGLFLPGTHIPIRAPEAISEHRPDYLLILPWNLKEEVMEQMQDIREWGGKFVVPIPTVTVLD